MALLKSIEYPQIALCFAQALAARHYETALAMTSRKFREAHSVGQLQDAFEAIVPMDWDTIGPIEVGHTMTDWPGKQATDLGWVYVSIGGEVYSEGVTVIVMEEEGVAKVREVEFGRP